MEERALNQLSWYTTHRRRIDLIGAKFAMTARKILIIDDELDVRMVIQSRLESKGYEVVSADSGEAGLAEIKKSNPELVVLDISLPGMNGYEIARALRNSTAGPRMVLIAVSGYGQEEDRRLSREAGFDHHLVKPVIPADLAKIIDALVIAD